MFEKNVYQARRQKLKQQVGKGLILLLGNEESSMNYKDNLYHFRQDSSFLYFFGLDKPGLAGIIDIDNDREIVFGNELTLDEIVWMGPQPSLAEQAAKAGITNVQPSSALISRNFPGSLTRPWTKVRLPEIMVSSPVKWPWALCVTIRRSPLSAGCTISRLPDSTTKKETLVSPRSNRTSPRSTFG